MTEERRKADRFALWFPMKLSSEGDVILGITRDVSEVGVLLVSAAEPKEGATVELTLSFPNDDEAERVVKGKIVRVQENEQDSDGLWRFRVAVEFDERVEELEPFLEELSRTSQPPPEP